MVQLRAVTVIHWSAAALLHRYLELQCSIALHHVLTAQRTETVTHVSHDTNTLCNMPSSRIQALLRLITGTDTSGNVADVAWHTRAAAAAQLANVVVLQSESSSSSSDSNGASNDSTHNSTALYILQTVINIHEH